MIDIVAPFLLLGALLVLIHRAVQRASTDPSPWKGLAPSHRLSRPDATPGWHVERTGATMSVWTSGLNGIPAAILHRRGVRTKAAWKLGYDLGILIGVGGMVVGLVGLLWSTAAVWKEVWREAELHARLKEEAAHVMRRAVEEGSTGEVAAKGSGAGMQPLVGWNSDSLKTRSIYGPAKARVHGLSAHNPDTGRNNTSITSANSSVGIRGQSARA